MARTKKTDPEKSADKDAKNATKQPEAEEQAKDATQEPETPEQAQDPAQEQETPEQTTDADAPPETVERDLFANIPNPCVYCGPTVRGVARQYTTYQGGIIPGALRDFIREHPEARRLIVSTAQFPNLRKRLDTPGTAEATLYKRVKGRL